MGLRWNLSLRRPACEIESRSGEAGVHYFPLLPFLTLPSPYPHWGDLHERKSERQGQHPALKSQATEREDEPKPE